MGDALDRLPTRRDLDTARTLVHHHFGPTPQYCWPLLDARLNATCWVKHENHTPVGAFKIRGGLVYLDRLMARNAGVAGLVSATRGNHGQSLAYAGRRLGLPVTIVVPEGNSREKNSAMRALGAEVLIAGDDFQDAVEASVQLAAERGWHRVPSFHTDLVAGVGTWALELLEAVPDLKTLYVPIGLGSGACGAIAAKRALGHPVDIVGVVSAGAPAYMRSLASGAIASHAVTTRLADGMACRTPDPLAFAVLAEAAIRVIAVTDEQVAQAMRVLFHDTHNVAEGAGAAGLAALMQPGEAAADGDNVGFVLCGGNVDTEVFANVLSGGTGHAE